MGSMPLPPEVNVPDKSRSRDHLCLRHKKFIPPKLTKSPGCLKTEGAKKEECVNEPGLGLYLFSGQKLRSVEAKPKTPVSDSKLNKKSWQSILGPCYTQKPEAPCLRLGD